MTEMGHFRQIDPLPTLSACPLRSDRVRTFAPQRIDAVCQLLTHALQQTTCIGCTDLLDHLVGAGEQRGRHGAAEGLADSFLAHVRRCAPAEDDVDVISIP
jgi:hypothetical protein